MNTVVLYASSLCRICGWHTMKFRSSPALSDVFENVEPCLVHLSASAGIGSRFLISTEGHIVTNAHIVDERGNTVKVGFINGAIVSGTVAGIDQEIDLACVVVKLAAPNAWALPFLGSRSGRSESGGRFCHAVQHPTGVAGTQRTGVVDAVYPCQRRGHQGHQLVARVGRPGASSRSR